MMRREVKCSGCGGKMHISAKYAGISPVFCDGRGGGAMYWHHVQCSSCGHKRNKRFIEEFLPFLFKLEVVRVPR